jgi:Peptidase_C39 like family
MSGPRRPRIPWLWIALGFIGILAATFGVYQIPAVQRTLDWRIDIAMARMRAVLYPGDVLPTAPADSGPILATPTAPAPKATAPIATPAPPAEVVALIEPGPSAALPSPAWEEQDWNNCGPATLAMTLRMFGWQGDQYTIAADVKPNRRDKNVRWDELVDYVPSHAPWLRSIFRVGGDLPLLKRFIANGLPVIVEKGIDIPDFGWAGHYLLLTAYDDAAGTFTAQDSFIAADQRVTYQALDSYWQDFNRLYILVYLPKDQAKVQALLGPDADESANRLRALQTSQHEAEAHPRNPYAWWNLGSNLNYFDRYQEAAAAFDQARALGLPWRMIWYQADPYRAYFNVGRYQEVIDLADSALRRTPQLEESLIWRGWARFSLGNRLGAVADFREALAQNSRSTEALAALESIGATP